MSFIYPPLGGFDEIFPVVMEKVKYDHNPPRFGYINDKYNYKQTVVHAIILISTNYSMGASHYQFSYFKCHLNICFKSAVTYFNTSKSLKWEKNKQRIRMRACNFKHKRTDFHDYVLFDRCK